MARKIFVLSGCLFLSLGLLKINSFSAEEVTAGAQAPLTLEKKIKVLEDIVSGQRKNYLALIEKTKGLAEENSSLRGDLEEKTKSIEGQKARLIELEKELFVSQREKTALELIAKQNKQVDSLRVPPLSTPSDNADKIIHLNLGYAYGLKGCLNEAIEEYRQALKFNPGNLDVHYNLGLLLAKKNRGKEAADEFQKALTGGPSDKEIYYNLSIIYATSLKDAKAADSCYSKFLNIASSDNKPAP